MPSGSFNADFVSVCFGINTLFGLYEKLTSYFVTFLYYWINLTARIGARFIKINEDSVAGVYAYYESCIKTQKRVAGFFRILTPFFGAFCFVALLKQHHISDLFFQYPLFYISPLLAYVGIGIMLFVVQGVRWIMMLVKIWWNSSELPFTLPSLPSED
jgi:hypothetical protein